MSKIIQKEILKRIPLNRELMHKLGKSTKTHGRSSILKVNRWIRDNRPDGPLTTMSRLTMISKALQTPLKNIIENVRTTEVNNIGTGELQTSI
jgi:hypothetical protein